MFCLGVWQNIVCVALYDIGEFTRFYPNGRVIASRLGAKDEVMKMMDSENAEIQRHTLQCISKIMVTNWEFLR
jgi:V-type H+-transporting ATPase subunit H